VRLADALAANVGQPNDIQMGRSITSLARVLVDAQCFSLAPEVVDAAEDVSRSRPSSILSALPYVRMPHRTMWVEWEPDSTIRRDADDTLPVPIRMGCLLEELGDLTACRMTWAWEHRPENIQGDLPLMIAPISVVADWSEDAPLVEAELSGVRNRIPSSVEVQQFIHQTRWRSLAGNAEEMEAFRQLMGHAVPICSPHCAKWINELSAILTEDQIDKTVQNWIGDVRGEERFIEALLVLMNARNGISQEREDLSRLNAARLRRRRMPLREYIITRLQVPRRMSQIMTGQSQSDRVQMRRHLVRGHFKIRRTGIFWWAPFPRGSGSSSTRSHYRVKV
jgi:hypothetical protein